MLSREARRYMTKKKQDPQQKKEPRRRNPVFGFLTILILVVVAVSFIGAPLLSRIGARSRLVFGTYNGEEIVYTPRTYFADQYDIAANRIRREDESGHLQSQPWPAWRYAFDQTVLHLAIMEHVERSGGWVSDERVTDSLLDYGPYLVNGIFSHKKYQATLRNEKTAISRLRREVLQHSRFLEDLFGLQAQSSGEQDFLRSMMNTERSFSFVTYYFSDFPQEKVLEYARDNEEKFSKIKLSRVTIASNETEADKIRDLALSGQSSFGDLARAYSKGYYADKGGDMGWQYYYDLEILFDSDEPLAGIFDLREGDVSAVFASGSSWIFFRCDADAVAPDLSDEELLLTIGNYVLDNEKGIIEAYFMEKAEQFKAAAEAGSFTEAAMKEGVYPPGETEYFAVNYADVFSARPVKARGEVEGLLQSASTNENFFSEAFSVEVGEMTDPILLNDRIVVLKVMDEREIPEEDWETLDVSLTYLPLFNLDRDVRTLIVEEDKLVDNFSDTFFTNIYPRQ